MIGRSYAWWVCLTLMLSFSKALRRFPYRTGSRWPIPTTVLVCGSNRPTISMLTIQLIVDKSTGRVIGNVFGSNNPVPHRKHKKSYFFSAREALFGWWNSWQSSMTLQHRRRCRLPRYESFPLNWLPVTRFVHPIRVIIVSSNNNGGLPHHYSSKQQYYWRFLPRLHHAHHWLKVKLCKVPLSPGRLETLVFWTGFQCMQPAFFSPTSAGPATPQLIISQRLNMLLDTALIRNPVRFTISTK